MGLMMRLLYCRNKNSSAAVFSCDGSSAATTVVCGCSAAAAVSSVTCLCSDCADVLCIASRHVNIQMNK